MFENASDNRGVANFRATAFCRGSCIYLKKNTLYGFDLENDYVYENTGDTRVVPEFWKLISSKRLYR
jgi:hypothetical protein